jgi:nicotinate-nucleotide--dimethylbenzimidazole phosphoribosyltransferase
MQNREQAMENAVLDDTLRSITPAHRGLDSAIRAHLDDLTKPQGSLGKLEQIALQYCLVQGAVKPTLGKKRIYCFAGDHGVADEGVSAFPREVTPQMVRNMLAGGAAINALSRHAGAELVVVDVGVADPLEGAAGLCRRKVRMGTDNIAVGPAMSVAEAQAALTTGIELAAQAQSDGVTLLGTGEMGIANTTPAAALLAAYLECPPDVITGHGTGVDDARLRHKIAVIRRALEANRASFGDPLRTLAALGGFEIAAISGLILGAAARHIPVVVDGFISSAGACAAVMLQPAVRDYLFFSHRSAERGHAEFFRRFGVEPILSLDMRLGEGTGAALARPIIEGAVKVYNEMATFSGAGVSGRE